MVDEALEEEIRELMPRLRQELAEAAGGQHVPVQRIREGVGAASSRAFLEAREAFR